jgi:beta-lactamase regulating signal transducer with metallopeptidase domain
MSFEFFIEMAWKSVLISGLALLIVTLLRSRSPADRAAVLRLGLVMLFLMPLVAVAMPALEVEATAAPEIVQPLAYAPASAVPVEAVDLPSEVAMPAPSPAWDDPTPLIRIAFLAGLMMIALRLAVGVATLARWTAAAREVECPQWRSALERARLDAGCASAPRLLVSAECPAPLSWGWRRPVILIDTDTLGQPEDADAILAHEMAHIARRDWPMLMLARVTVALFWFNPLVWLLERECIQQAEEAADSHALGQVEPAHYAQTLLSCAQCASAMPLPANRVASNRGLGRRVRAILDGRLRATASGSFWTVAAMLGCVAVAAPVSALKLVQAVAPAPPAAPAVPAALPSPARLAVAPRAPAMVPAAPAPATALHASALAAAQAPVAPRALPVPPRPPVPPVLAAAVEARVRGRLAARPPIDEEALEAQVEAAVERAVEAGEAARASMAQGAAGMEAGANGMERGAAKMRAQAARFRNRDYREAQIRKAAARGERLTHEELIEAADEMEQGAEEMRQGAREMREGAREMREGRQPRHRS